MEKTRKWRKILAMMLTVGMMLQNAQSVIVFADVTNEQIEQRLAGNQAQTEETPVSYTHLTLPTKRIV